MHSLNSHHHTTLSPFPSSWKVSHTSKLSTLSSKNRNLSLEMPNYRRILSFRSKDKSLLASAKVIVEKEALLRDMDPAIHNYTPLNRESSEIRLFSFQQGIDGKIFGQHHVFPISKCPKFIALSYTWGTPGSENIISLDGNDISIRDNLNEALKSIIWLRARHKVFLSARNDDLIPAKFYVHPPSRATNLRDKAVNCQYFWIDSICIDQQDVLERNHQVGLMKNIYSDADFVIAWLGSQDSAYRNIRKQEITLPLMSRDAPLGPELLLYMEGLKSCEYWRRLWIVQEVVLARDILVGWENFFSPGKISRYLRKH